VRRLRGDRSVAARRRRSAALVVELKAGAPLAFGGARLQLARAADAIAEIAATGVIAQARFEQALGDPAALLAHLRATPP
jgi:hypothetical protein